MSSRDKEVLNMQLTLIPILVKAWNKTYSELSDMMNKSRRAVQMLMKELLDEGEIERIGSKKTGSWLVK